ncbi:lysylphosphatidylglycerol synthase transmembrane domain-containing protein [Haloparvum sp. AD34]
MTRPQLRTFVVGFAAAAVVLGLLASLVGVEDLLQELSRANSRDVAVVVGLHVIWLVAWGLALRAVLAALDISVKPVQSILLFTAGMATNNVTPLGQAGGEPFTALLYSSEFGVDYEESLAAAVSADTLNFVPSVALALGGVGWLTLTASVDDDLLTVVLAAAAVAFLVLLAARPVWRRRSSVAGRVADLLTSPFRKIGGMIPRISPPTREGIVRRIEGFLRAVERVGTDPRRLAFALTFSIAGWTMQALGLWVAFAAVGASVPFALAIVAVTLTPLAGATPMPGGTGGIEAALIALFVAAPIGVGTSTIAAAVAIYRVVNYWLPTLSGGAVAIAVASRSDRM